MARPRRAARIGLFAVAVVALSLGGAWIAVRHSGVSAAHVEILTSLSPVTLATLAGLCVLIYVTDVWRYLVLGRAVQQRISLRAGLDASVANFFFSWLTPGSAMGAPATIFMLARRGIPWHAATVIAFAKSITGIALLVATAAVLIVLGQGPRFDRKVLAVALPGTALTVFLLVLLSLAVVWPERARSAVQRLAAAMRTSWLANSPRRQRALAASEAGVMRAVDRLAQLRSGGLLGLLAIAASHFAYFAAFIGIAVVLCRALGATSTLECAAVATVFAGFSYVAPTPGGAGLAEAVAVPFFGGILPAPAAVVAALTFRALTFYLQVVVGLIYLSVVGGLGEIARLEAGRVPPATDE